MAFLAVVFGGLAFGAADQFLGTVHAMNALGPWSVSVSLLSAPWLMLPFLVGWTQRRPRRAAAIGLVVTLSALSGYFAMTLSPAEGAHFSLSGMRDLLGTNQLNEIGGKSRTGLTMTVRNLVRIVQAVGWLRRPS